MAADETPNGCSLIMINYNVVMRGVSLRRRNSDEDEVEMNILNVRKWKEIFVKEVCKVKDWSMKGTDVQLKFTLSVCF